ncbi:uncharacterized protein DUF3152 [Mumia flava]|uniref:Uncharacterized protein DUF3152 n=1 Tax=Mumia flava TaxID=1348852 RepID=A0A2M9BJ35_9ACTN|nr:DUF3152 domain-containing protein [Mumia flava]PJJ57968.1 uncharacterized protein DUF3152 [Mumia flava]
MLVRALAATLLLSLVPSAPAAAAGANPAAMRGPAATDRQATVAAQQEITVVLRPRTVGTVRFRQTLRRTLGRYSVRDNTYATRWLRDGRPIRGATKARYRLRAADVGHRIAVRVTVRHPGHVPRVTRSVGRRVKHVRDVRATVRYTVRRDGSFTKAMRTFRRQVAETLNDPRGWRAAGVRFKRVSSGGSMTVVLARASRLPRYSSVCSVQWSCRVGRYAIINRLRWRTASPAWNAAADTTRRGYRHMVVNHEVGHWLGWGHKQCSRQGRRAAVMMQQSISLGGCRFNSWPKRAELRVPRYR